MNDIRYIQRLEDTENNIKDFINKKRNRPSKDKKHIDNGVQNFDLSQDYEDSANEDTSKYRNGRWLPFEHIRFVKGCLAHGNNWKKVSHKHNARLRSSCRRDPQRRSAHTPRNS